MKPLSTRANLARIAVLLALTLLLLAILLAAGAGPAYRFDLLSLQAAFGTLRYGVYLAIGSGIAGLIALAVSAWLRRPGPALVATLVAVASLMLVSVPMAHWQQAQSVPRIHDITTDTLDPPAFQALAAAREAAPNAVDYPGENTARQQHETYPDIMPLQVDAPLATVRDAAEAQVRAQGWDVAAVTETHIEAAATTLWFGFKDDVVIRFRQENSAVRVDMRSASRVGLSDVGANATRIRAFLDALEGRLP